MQNIILIGFMGSGKTSIANMLAEKTGMPFIEMDDLIVQISERESVNDIFEQDGEIRFRESSYKESRSEKPEPVKQRDKAPRTRGSVD